MPKPRDEPAHFEDPRSIRALAHPGRIAIINALASGEELTATQCSELTGLSPSATAYHLKLLEQYGFAEPAQRRPDGRERPWRATDRQVPLELDGSTPAGSSAGAAVMAAYFDATRALALEFAEGQYAEPASWRNAILANADLWLTAKEFEQLGAKLEAVLDPYRSRSLKQREGTRRVRVMNLVVPHPRRTPDRSHG